MAQQQPIDDAEWVICDHYQRSAPRNPLKSPRLEIGSDPGEPYRILPEGCRVARVGPVGIVLFLQPLLTGGDFDHAY